MKNVEFKKDLICESMGKQLYDGENYDAAVELFRAVADGLTLTELSRKENGERLDNLTRIYDVIFAVAPSVAQKNFGLIKDQPKKMKFLENFKRCYASADEKVTGVELYEQWVSFSMQRILFWKEIDGCQTPYWCWEQDVLSRLCIDDELFLTQGMIAYGKALERGLITPMTPDELSGAIEEMTLMYCGSAFETNLTFEQWAISYLKGKNRSTEVSSIVPGLVNLTIRVYERLLSASEGAEVSYDRLLEMVSRIWKMNDGADLAGEEIEANLDFMLMDKAARESCLKAMLNDFEKKQK